MLRITTVLAALLALLVAIDRGAAQERSRSDVPEKYLWNLADVYASDEAWNQAKEQIAAQFDGVLAFKGKLASGPDQLLGCLKLDTQISKELTQLDCYASMKSDQDTRVSKYQGMKQQIDQLVTDYRAKASFIAPEVVEMDRATIDSFVAQQSGLKPYRMFLSDIQRTKAHRLSDKEEEILAQTGMLAATPWSIYSIFANAELPFPEITLSDGTTCTLNQAGYGRHRASPNRADRKLVFDTFWETFGKFKQTLGTDLNAQVKKDMFYARVRDYESSLHTSLDRNNIPVEVYRSLVNNVEKNLGTFHRYLKLKKRMLGVDQLEYYDVYAPVVKGVDLQYSYDEAQQLVLDAVQPLGEDYVGVTRQSFADRWIDVYPNPGKRSGAYCNGGCYDVHPYMLLNYNGQYDDVSTLAHELGHAMHSYYSNKKQPYPTADYATFVAEVASTLNEALLFHKTLDSIEDEDTRLSLLMSYLDSVKGTVFRQTQFASFELAMHERAERGEPLTGDSLTELYGDIIRKYYGHDDGVCHIDEAYCAEWAYVPHFYMNFYVYQYATSFTASTALAENILSGEPAAVERTMEFLSAGGSDYPIAILKKAGVDMTTEAPFKRTMQAMNRVMDEIEEILDKRES